MPAMTWIIERVERVFDPRNLAIPLLAGVSKAGMVDAALTPMECWRLAGVTPGRFGYRAVNED
jgi:hypothetical protein